MKYCYWGTSFWYITSYWYIPFNWSISQLTLLEDYALTIYQNISQEPIIRKSGVLSVFQPKKLAAIDCIRFVDKQRPGAEAIYDNISREEASNVNKTNIINSIDELVKQNVVVNKKNISGDDSLFPYSDNLVWPVAQIELASNSATPKLRQKNQSLLHPISPTLP